MNLRMKWSQVDLLMFSTSIPFSKELMINADNIKFARLVKTIRRKWTNIVSKKDYGT